MSTATIIIIVVLAAIVFWIFSIYNGLVAIRQRVEQSFANIDVQLKQRRDLVFSSTPIATHCDAFPARLAVVATSLAPIGSAALSTTRRNTKLECTPVTPLMRVIRFSSNSW